MESLVLRVLDGADSHCGSKTDAAAAAGSMHAEPRLGNVNIAVMSTSRLPNMPLERVTSRTSGMTRGQASKQGVRNVLTKAACSTDRSLAPGTCDGELAGEREAFSRNSRQGLHADRGQGSAPGQMSGLVGCRLMRLDPRPASMGCARSRQLIDRGRAGDAGIERFARFSRPACATWQHRRHARYFATMREPSVLAPGGSCKAGWRWTGPHQVDR
jgi:hypothetical protein